MDDICKQKIYNAVETHVFVSEFLLIINKIKLEKEIHTHIEHMIMKGS